MRERKPHLPKPERERQSQECASRPAPTPAPAMRIRATRLPSASLNGGGGGPCSRVSEVQTLPLASPCGRHPSIQIVHLLVPSQRNAAALLCACPYTAIQYCTVQHLSATDQAGVNQSIASTNDKDVPCSAGTCTRRCYTAPRYCILSTLSIAFLADSSHASRAAAINASCGLARCE